MTTSISAKSNGTQGALLVNGTETFSFDGTGVDSPVSLSASIASNAITVTLTKGGWRFRSTTPSTGTPTYVKTDTDLTLTIASTDSFGLVTAAGNQRLAIICFNDAGTLRLAATALYGGVQLDETNFLSATTTATTATAIDCGVVVTSKAYRVVGFIDATFTTAVGWGSLGTVQPIGGQALAAMSSFGYEQTWQNVTGSRAYNTTYYNTTGKTIFVAIQVIVQASYASVTDQFQVNGVYVGSFRGNGAVANMPAYYYFAIPPGASYYLANWGSVLLDKWAELR